MVLSTCGSCGYHCPIEVKVENGKASSISGVKSDPITKGRICPKGFRYLDTVYHSDRVLSPLRKTNSHWNKTNWHAAISEIGLKIQKAIHEHGPSSIAIVEGKGNGEWFDPHWIMARRFADTIGTPNYFSVQGVCWTSRAMAEIATFGSMIFPDIEHTKNIILWGSNPSASNPPLAMNILDSIKKGAQLSIIDPREIPLTSRSVHHLKIKPGTDGILALGLIHLLFKENWIDWDFTSQWIHGLDQLEDHVKQFPLEYTSSITDIPEKEIYAFAKKLGETHPGIIIAGEAPAHSINGYQTFRSIHLLNALTGNIDIPGGMIRGRYPPIKDLRSPSNVSLTRYGKSDFPFFTSFTNESQITLLERLLKDKTNPLKVLIIEGSNPVLTLPQGNELENQIKKIDLVIVIDLFHTSSADLAHYFLPACSSIERFGFVPYPLPEKDEAMLLSLRSPVIPPLQDSKPDWRIWQLLANQIGYAQQFPWESEKALYEEFLRPSGIGIEDFFSQPNGIFFGRSPNRLSDSDKDYKFQTPTGKIEASSTITEKHGYSPLPNWHSLSIVKTDTITGSPYPLLLTTGPRNVAYTHSRERNIPQLKKITPAPRVAIHPKTAQIRNIFNNQPVMLKNDKGQMEGIAYITSGIREDTIMVPHGWEKPSNCNNLIDSDLSSMDRVSGFPSYRFAYCEIFPIDQ